MISVVTGTHAAILRTGRPSRRSAARLRRDREPRRHRQAEHRGHLRQVRPLAPQQRLVGVHQCNVDGEFARPRQELLGAVQGVDQPIAVPLPPLRNVRGDGLFGKYREGGVQRIQARQQDMVRGEIGVR